MLLLAAPAAGDAEDAWPGDDRWVPSFAVISGASVHGWSGSVVADCLDPVTMLETDCNPTRTVTDPNEANRGSFFGTLGDLATGDDLNVAPFVGGNVQIMSPVLDFLPGKPRLFIAGEVPYNFGTDRDVASFRNPSTLQEPRTFTPVFKEESLQGVGSRVQGQLDDLSYGASAGLAFPFEAFGRRLRLKVSGGWYRQTINVEALSLFGLCPPTVGGAPMGVVNGCDVGGDKPILPRRGFTRVIRLQEKRELKVDGIGPGVEVEMDTGRVGPLGVSLFAGVQGFYVIGDRRISSSAVRTTIGGDNLKRNFSDPPGAPVSHGLNWSFSVDPWVYRGTVGVRFHFVGWNSGG